MRCCAHILNLVVNDGLRELTDSIASIRNSVRFKKCIDFAGISSNNLVFLDVLTRWNSTYIMLEAVEKFQLTFEKLEFEDSIYFLIGALTDGVPIFQLISSLKEASLDVEFVQCQGAVSSPHPEIH
uniref:AC transposase n=1 Tax=Cajanus cajan TaxID=3821 RepID=A0A151QQE1_CAJCA|nr:Putative AC transposase [Cajanus cajan]